MKDRYTQWLGICLGVILAITVFGNTQKHTEEKVVAAIQCAWQAFGDVEGNRHD